MLNEKVLIELGARVEIARLAGQIGEIARAVPQLRGYAIESIETAFGKRKPGRPQRPTNGDGPYSPSGSAPSPTLSASSKPQRKRNAMSDEMREAQAERMRARWAAVKKAGGASLDPSKKKRKTTKRKES